MTPEQQLNFCTNCVRKAIRKGRTIKPGYDLEDAIQETYAKVLKNLNNVGKLEAGCQERASQGKPDSLAALICRAANSALGGIAYHSAKDSKATSRTITSEDGDEIDILDTIAATADTERSAIIRATLRDFYDGLDDTDKIIFKGMTRGDTERAIAPHVGISATATHNRRVKILSKLAALL